MFHFSIPALDLFLYGTASGLAAAFVAILAASAVSMARQLSAQHAESIAQLNREYTLRDQLRDARRDHAATLQELGAAERSARPTWPPFDARATAPAWCDVELDPLPMATEYHDDPAGAGAPHGFCCDCLDCQAQAFAI